MTTKALSTAAQQYVSALEAQAAAERAVAVAKSLLLEAVSEAGVNEVTVNGKKVEVIYAVRRNFLTEKLRELVTAKVFDAVTKTAVEPKAFDKARQAGDIPAEVEEAVVSPTPYERVVVKEVTEEVSSVAV